jgi:acyl-CoA synthetase (AMP-forming)/AMP-acid ligase II
MAYVVLKPDATLTTDDLIAFCRPSLATYKLPRCVEFSKTDLPKNSSGKVLKKNLRERFRTQQQRAIS